MVSGRAIWVIKVVTGSNAKLITFEVLVDNRIRKRNPMAKNKSYKSIPTSL
jgi:hypothetical protein